MPIMNKLPLGGGASSSGDASLNIYTQINEPTKKDGIWIKTNNQYNKAIVDNDHVFSQDGVCKIISNSISNIYSIEKIVIYHNELYAFQSDALYKSNNLSAVLNNGESFVWTKLIRFQDKTVGNYRISTNVPSSVVIYDDKICMTVRAACDDVYSYEILITYNGTDFKMYENPINYSAYDSYGLFIYNGDLCCVDYAYLSVQYSYFSKINISNGAKTQINIFGTERVYNQVQNPIFYNNKIFYKTGGGGLGVIGGYVYSEYNTKAKEIFIFNNDLYYTGYNFSSSDGYWHYLYKINKDEKNTVTQVYDLTGGYVSDVGYCFVQYNNYLLYYKYRNGTRTINTYQLSPNVYSPQTLILQRNTSENGTYRTGIFDLNSVVDKSLQPLIEGDANRCLYGFNDCYYFADTAFDWSAPMYYGDGTQWIKFKN